MNTSLERLQSIDLGDLDDVEGCQARWIIEVKKTLKVEYQDHLTHDKFNSLSITKVKLACWLGEARDTMCRQAEVMARQK